MTRPPHIALYSQCGFGNFGNDATLEVVLNHLRARFPQARFTCVVRNPEVVAAQFGVRAIPMYPEPHFKPRDEHRIFKAVRRAANELVRIWSTCKVLRTIDYFVIPGGGRFDDFNSLATEQPYWLWKWTRLARLFRIPVELYCIGAGPVDFPLSAWFYRGVARAVTRRSFRDEESRRFVAETFKIDTKGDELTADLVFATPVRLGARPPSPSVAVVGVGVMEYNNRRGTKGGPEDRYFSYINSLTAFSLGVLARGKSVKILIGEWCDRSAARDLHARLMATAPECADRIELCAANDIHDVVASVEQCDIVVATRFHNVVAALRMGRPVLSQGYASKNVRLMEEFGLSPYCQTIETCDVDRLLAQFDDLCANAGALAAPISAKASALHDAMNARLDQLADRIAAAVGAALAPRAAAPAASKPSGGAPRAPHPWAA